MAPTCVHAWPTRRTTAMSSSNAVLWAGLDRMSFFTMDQFGGINAVKMFAIVQPIVEQSITLAVQFNSEILKKFPWFVAAVKDETDSREKSKTAELKPVAWPAASGAGLEEVLAEEIKDIIQDQDQSIDLGLKVGKCPYIDVFLSVDFQIFYLKKSFKLLMFLI